MCSRPRKVSDEEIFAAAHRIMARLGPAQWRLADIAAEAGLTAGALVQRFGSKRRLMLALAERVVEATPAMFARLRAVHLSPLATLRAYAVCIAEMGESPRALAHHLVYLQLDLTDPDLHRHLRNQALAVRRAIGELLADAVAAGELAPAAETSTLARAVEVTLSGSLLTWAVYQDGPASTWVLEDLDNLLRPLRGSSARPSERPRKSPTRRAQPR
jgi:AcrR family transcriptional regulator